MIDLVVFEPSKSLENQKILFKEDSAKGLALDALKQKFKVRDISNAPKVEEAVYNDKLTWQVTYSGVSVDFIPGEKVSYFIYVNCTDGKIEGFDRCM